MEWRHLPMLKFPRIRPVRILLQNRYIVDLFAALMLFTRIPVKWSFFSTEPPDLTRASWSFPLIGLLVGVLSGFLGDLCIYMQLPIFLSCVTAIIFSVLVTGAFHEDGLADMADGFGAGGSAERLNRIMHDSRLGTYGTAALILGFLFRVGVALSLVELGYSLMVILAFGFATGKLAIIIMRNYFDISAFSKTGSIIEAVTTKNFIIALIIWFVPLIIVFPLLGILVGITFVLAIIILFGRMSSQKLGGLTGDVLGATAFVSEMIFLFGLTLYLRL